MREYLVAWAWLIAAYFNVFAALDTRNIHLKAFFIVGTVACLRCAHVRAK